MPRLSEFPAGGTVFLDANIFLEHLIRQEPACTAVFQRALARDIHLVTSVVVLAEVRHRLLLTEAIRQGYVAEPKRALDLLRRRPELITRLGSCDVSLNLLLETPLRVVHVTRVQFHTAQRLSLHYRLLTNDALHLAVLRAHRFRHFASADQDFRRVPSLTLWYP